MIKDRNIYLFLLLSLLLVFIFIQFFFKPDFRDRVSNNALFWVGKEFRPGERSQCAHFVRHIFISSGYTIGVTKTPSDNKFPIDEGFANSFSGDDIGVKISKIEDLKKGDIVLFQNTYGEWPSGTITHAGIYTGDGYFVHRPTLSEPVQKTLLTSYGRFKEGRRIIN